MGEMSNALNISAENFEGKRPLGRPRFRWQENIKMGVKEIWLRVWTGFTRFWIGTKEGPWEHGKEKSFAFQTEEEISWSGETLSDSAPWKSH
jgi:hypothetical protein